MERKYLYSYQSTDKDGNAVTIHAYSDGTFEWVWGF